MKFRMFDFGPSERRYCSSGSRFHPEYQASFSDRGDYKLEKVSEIDTYAMIQAQRPSCDLRMIIDRFMQGEPVPQMTERSGAYYDLTELPDTPQEWKRVEMELQDVYDCMSVEEKALYGNNFLRFLFDRFSVSSDKDDVSVSSDVGERNSGVSEDLQGVSSQKENGLSVSSEGN